MTTRIEQIGDEWKVVMVQGYQSFMLDYAGTKSQALWMKDQLDITLKAFKNDEPPKAEILDGAGYKPLIHAFLARFSKKKKYAGTLFYEDKEPA